MTTPKKKPGRKPQHYTDAENNPVVGLARRPSDGRWRIIGTNITFTEPDERKAIAKFNALNRGETEPTVYLQMATETVKPIMKLNGGKSTDMVAELSEAELFIWFADQIRERPKYVAAQTGI